ncbi:MAG: histidine kinase dimerization/phospho-acceptor domain-containing protein [Chitinispirillaceae bacterium]|jgi:nitrogen fixation/metabolism regulation signal transduction histidine kinase
MRFAITTKLFIGFLCIIALNSVYIIIANRINDVNSFVDILKNTNEVKNRLLRLKTLHRIQGPSIISYQKVGMQESIENFRSINRDIVYLIDTIKCKIDSISVIDTRLASKTYQGSNPAVGTHMSGFMSAIISYTSSYSALFEKLVSLRDSLHSTLAVSNEKNITDTLDNIEDKVTLELDNAETITNEQTVRLIRAISNDINDAKKTTIIILVCLTFFSIIFSLIFSRTITNSLRRLKESATRIGKSDFDINPMGFPNDETGDLAKAFFDMAVDLRNKQKELIKSKRLAAIGEVVASVNHEINNPLMIISGNAQFLEMSMDGYPNEMKERVKTIIEESERISQITRKLREIRNPVSEDYTPGGGQMIDLEKSL